MILLRINKCRRLYLRKVFPVFAIMDIVSVCVIIAEFVKALASIALVFIMLMKRGLLGFVGVAHIV